jgi:DNA repair protein RecO (recombination protein O)
MKQLVTTGIVLARTDYGEADRILTIITPDQGKLRLMAKGVRRLKSKLAGGIELFSVSHITYIRGRGDMGTLISTRLEKYYDHIVEDIDRTMLGYECIKLLNKVTEDEPDPEYFALMEQLLIALNESKIHNDIVSLWFYMQLLRLGGHTPNLASDTMGNRLTPDATYIFSYDDMAFTPRPDAEITAAAIKFMRLGFEGHVPRVLQQIAGVEALVPIVSPLVRTMLSLQLRQQL